MAIGAAASVICLRAVATSDLRTTNPTTSVTASAMAGPIIQPRTIPRPMARATNSTTQRKMKKSSLTIGRILSFAADSYVSMIRLVAASSLGIGPSDSTISGAGRSGSRMMYFLYVST